MVKECTRKDLQAATGNAVPNQRSKVGPCGGTRISATPSAGVTLQNSQSWGNFFAH